MLEGEHLLEGGLLPGGGQLPGEGADGAGGEWVGANGARDIELDATGHSATTGQGVPWSDTPLAAGVPEGGHLDAGVEEAGAIGDLEALGGGGALVDRVG